MYLVEHNEQYQCRRFPPTPVMLPAPVRGVLSTQAQYQVVMVLANVELENWCGEWTLSERLN